MTNLLIADFVSRHRLPEAFLLTARDHYMPLVDWLGRLHRPNETALLGISGAQGTGKSTLAEFIKHALESNSGWRVAVLSLDDFYLTRAERRRLAVEIHPLLQTRGVPGTHDLGMLDASLSRLCHLGAADEMPLPRFDKSWDDRADPDAWPVITGPVDLVVLEGWCVGSLPQDEDALATPINQLERDRDTDGTWRSHVNDSLAGAYANLFARLDALLFLRAPNFDAVYRWRCEQEEKLAATSSGARLMDEEQVAQFIQFFERLTRHNLETVPAIADVVLELDDNHAVVHSLYRD